MPLDASKYKFDFTPASNWGDYAEYSIDKSKLTQERLKIEEKNRKLVGMSEEDYYRIRKKNDIFLISDEGDLLFLTYARDCMSLNWPCNIEIKGDMKARLANAEERALFLSQKKPKKDVKLNA